MFWKRFFNLCNENHESPNGVAKKLSISSGAVTHWKNGKVPHHETLLKIANYFHVSVDYLLGNDAKPDAVASNSIAPISDHDSMLDVISDLSKKQNKTQKELCDFLGVNQCTLLWNNIVKLCNEKNISPSRLCKELGFSNATATHWKNGSSPNGDALQKLANYLGVTVDDLLGRETSPNQDEPFTISSVEKQLVSYYRKNPNMHDVIDKILGAEPLPLSDHEKQIILAYRLKTEMQCAVDRILGIDDDER